MLDLPFIIVLKASDLKQPLPAKRHHSDKMI